MQKECLVPSMEHDIEFKEASFGQHSFKCKICGEWFTELEDSQP